MSASVRRLLVVTIAILAIAAIWLVIARRAQTPSQSIAQPQITVTAVRQSSVDETIELAGRVGPPAGTQAKLAFSVPGVVESVSVRLGQRVDAGAPLARLDATSYSLAAQQAQADAQAAISGAAGASTDRFTVKLRVDEAELARQRRLYAAGVVALRDVQAAEGALAADRADARSARALAAQAAAQSQAANARAAGASYDLGRTVLRAPSPGTVVGIFLQPGATVDATVAVVALAADRQNVATLDVPVSDLPRVRTGDPVVVRSGSARWEGRVAGIAPAVDPATGLALLSASGVPAGTPPGTPVSATVTVGSATGLVVPRSAVVEDPQTGATLVFVRKRDGHGVRFEARKVRLGAQDARLSLVVSGLHAGETIAAQGAIDLLAQPDGGD